jgi:hypothetical protein
VKSNKSCTKSWTEGGALDQGSSSRMIPAAYSCSSSELFIRVGVDDGVVHKHAISRGEKLKARRLGQVADRRYNTRHARQLDFHSRSARVTRYLAHVMTDLGVSRHRNI